MSFREDEKFALEALIGKLGGSYREGADPPDGYLRNVDGEFAVEVTRLIEPAYRGDGSTLPRIADEAVAKRIGDKLVSGFAERVDPKCSLLLHFSVPVKDSRKLESRMRETLAVMLQRDENERPHKVKLDELEDEVSISLFKHDEVVPKDRRIEYSIFNSRTSSHVHDNLVNALRERVSNKQSKYRAEHRADEYWLVLLSEYWVASERSIQLAYDEAELFHCFDRVYLVRGRDSVHQLYAAP